jgi:hypothetical protein
MVTLAIQVTMEAVVIAVTVAEEIVAVEIHQNNLIYGRIIRK